MRTLPPPFFALQKLFPVPLITCLWLCCIMGVHAQEQIIRPLLSPALTGGATGTRSVLRALVVGIGRYQDSSFASQPYTRRDAEAFAAFLKTPGGGSIANGDLVLLTDEQATLARVSDALSWLVEVSRQGDKIVVYCGLLGQVQGQGDARLLLYDSPQAPTDAGFLSLPALSALLGGAARHTGAGVLMFVELDARMNAGASRTPRAGRSRQNGLFSVRLAGKKTTTPAGSGPAGPSFGSALLYGLLGAADLNNDEKVYTAELTRYLGDRRHVPAGPGHLAWLAISDKNEWLCTAGAFARQAAGARPKSGFTPILALETQALDPFMAQHADVITQQLYEDFILTLRLGYLLPPPERCAAVLLDSLLREPALSPVHRQLQRRLAVAYQDETQQALNAYLQANVQELARRRNNRDFYGRYPAYLRRALDLLGPSHFMRKSLDAKRLYFEGLLLRLDAQQTRDSALLPRALEKQQQAIALEPEAAFVLNEMGVVLSLLGVSKTAEKYFRSAIQNAPGWSIPHANLCSVLSARQRHREAIREGFIAVRLGPWSPGAYLRLGEALHLGGDLPAAEKLYRRTLLLDPESPDAHYDLACVLALTGRPDAALDALRLALHHGFNRAEHLLADPDLALLRGRKEFRELVTAYFPGR